jgi:hypothetical protein
VQNLWVQRGGHQRIGHIDRMTKLARNGWVVEATILEGFLEKTVRCFVVGTGTEAEAILAVRASPGIGICPEDDVILRRQLSQSEIEAKQLQDGIEVIPIGVPT